MRTSSIRLRANARLAILHEDYLEICDGNMLAAMLLSVLVYWTDIKIAKKEEIKWIWKTHEDFQEDLLFNRGMKAPHRTTISSALAVLKAKGFIQWRKNPKLALDRTRQYLVNLEEVQAAIDRLPAIVSRKSDIPMLENRHSIEQATEANPSGYTNVGITTYDECRKTDNALSEKQHCNVEKPTSNTNDYITEITNPEITEGTHVTSAIAESDVPAPIDFKTESAKLKAVSLQIVTDYEEALVIPPRLTLKQKEQSVDSGTSVQHSGASPGTSPTRAGAAQGEEKPPMALTAKQIKAQADKRAKELWTIIESERNTKYTSRQRELYENKEGMECLIADDISDEDLRTGLQTLDAFQSKSFTVLKFYSWLPNLSAKAPTPMTNGIAPRKNFTGMGRMLKAN